MRVPTCTGGKKIGKTNFLRVQSERGGMVGLFFFYVCGGGRDYGYRIKGKGEIKDEYVFGNRFKTILIVCLHFETIRRP